MYTNYKTLEKEYIERGRYAKLSRVGETYVVAEYVEIGSEEQGTYAVTLQRAHKFRDYQEALNCFCQSVAPEED